MELLFREITAENRKAVLELKTAEGQEGYIESVAECLEEADGRDSWRPLGIYLGETLVGFAMYGFFHEYPPAGRVWMDRLLIDERYQGQGYGKKALELLLKRLWQEYRQEEIYLSVVPANTAAMEMYGKAGFVLNGEIDTKGEKVMVRQNILPVKKL